MTCNEAAEFVSALCDGERIPAAAAGHIGHCENCQARLREYLAAGAEMRLAASLEIEQELKPMVWKTKRGSISTFWRKGWEMMRIPRFAFAALVMGIVALGSTLAIVKVRAHSDGSVVILTVSGSGEPTRCPLSTVDKNIYQCMAVRRLEKNMVSYQINLLGRDGNRVQLGVRTRVYPLPTGASGGSYTLEDLKQAEQKTYWFEPGETLRVDVPGVGALTVTGEWTDHMPPMGSVNTRNHDLDPGPNELRIVSPLLLRDKKVVGDMEGGGASPDKPEDGVMIYFHGEGLFILSLQPIEGAVQGQININRISFASNGRAYTFLTAEPVARGKQVWILHDRSYKPSKDAPTSDMIGTSTVKVMLEMTKKQ